MPLGSPNIVDGVAPKLTQPPGSTPGPPTRGPLHKLPLDALHWDDFERLCWRLVARDGDVRQTALYGVPGQDQEGIDLYAQLKDESFAVFQCKRHKKISATKIVAAVDRFLGDDWGKVATTFALCTSHSLEEKTLADAVLTQIERLRAMVDQRRPSGIAFKHLDLNQISLRCKDAPDIVWDFFGEQWARAFCDPALVAGLGVRLHPNEVVALRDRLRRFYLRTFAEHDFEPPPQSVVGVEHLGRRYVPLDIIERRTWVEHDRSEYPKERRVESDGQERDREARLGARTDAQAETSHAAVSVRRPAHAWLPEADCTVIVGEAGMGKSTLLRYIACDLLSKTPTLSTLSTRWHGYIPVWVPFPAWVRRIAQGSPDTGAQAAVLAWLVDRDERDLVPLVQKAFEDGRLMFLVDGLDEYLEGDRATAQDALGRLLALQSRQNGPLIAAGRPAPTRRLRPHFDDIRLAELAEPDAAQRRALVLRWFSTQTSTHPEGEQPSDRAEAFLRRLDAAPEAARLASSPLMLVFLVRVWSRTGSLATTRPALLQQVIDLLLTEHPIRRQAASGTRRPTELPDDAVLKDALASLAFSTRQSGFSMTCRDAKAALCAFLKDETRGPGLMRDRAYATAPRLLAWLTDHVGVLSMGDGGVEFRHRALLEHLTAVWLVGGSESDQAQAIDAHAADPGWVEVWPDLIALAQSPGSAQRLFDGLRERRRLDVGAFHLDRSLVMAAVTDGQLPKPTRCAFIAELAREVRGQRWWPHRADLVRIVARGLLCPGLKETVEGILRVWIPRPHTWISGLWAALGDWERSVEMTEALIRGIADEDDTNGRLAAAEVLARHATSAAPTELFRLARGDADPLTRAAATLAYAWGWPHATEAELLTAPGLAGGSPEMMIACWHLQLQRTGKLDIPLSALRLSGIESGLDSAFRPHLRDALARAWAGDRDKRDTLLGLLREANNGQLGKWSALEVDRDTVFEILLSAFPGDDAVATYVATLLDQRPYFPTQLWGLLARHFRRHPLLTAPVDEWLARRVTEFAPDRTDAAIVSGSTRARNAMLADLERGSEPWGPARVLLEEWATDTAVGDVLLRFVEATPDNAAALAYYLSRIIGDPKRARGRLLELLCVPTSFPKDIVVAALGELDGAHNDREAADAIADLLDQVPPLQLSGWWEAFAWFLWHPRIQERARSVLDHAEPPLSAIARGCVHAPELRSRVLGTATPLPTGLRQAIWEELSRLGPASTAGRAWLTRYDEETDPLAKAAAALGHYRATVTDGASRAAAIERLTRDVACRGNTYGSRRQAAFAAAIDLGHPGILKDLDTEAMPGHRVSVPLGGAGRSPNAPFMAVIARAWGALQKCYGADVFERLGAGHFTRSTDENYLFGRDDFLKLLAMYGDTSEALRSWLLEQLETARIRSGSAAVLRFLGRARPRSRLLHDFCVGTLRGSTSGPMAPERIAAAEILAGDFVKDDGVRAELEAIPDGMAGIVEMSRGRPAHLYALALGWRASAVLSQLWQRRKEGELDDFVTALVAFLHGSPVEVVDILKPWLDGTGHFRADYGHGLRVLLSRRVAEDETLAQLLVNAAGGSARHFVSLLPIVAATRPDRAVDWASRQVLLREMEAESPAFAHDLFSGVGTSVLGAAARILNGDRQA